MSILKYYMIGMRILADYEAKFLLFHNNDGIQDPKDGNQCSNVYFHCTLNTNEHSKSNKPRQVVPNILKQFKSICVVMTTYTRIN